MSDIKEQAEGPGGVFPYDFNPIRTPRVFTNNKVKTSLPFPNPQSKMEKILNYIVEMLSYEDNFQYDRSSMTGAIKRELKYTDRVIGLAYKRGVEMGIIYMWGPSNKQKTLSLVPRPTTVDMKTALDADLYKEYLKKRCQASGHRVPIFPLDEMNEACGGGPMRSSVVGFVAKTKRGKTHFVSCCAAAALKKDQKVMIIQVEAGAEYYNMLIARNHRRDPDIKKEDLEKIWDVVGPYIETNQLCIPPTTRPVDFEALVEGINLHKPDLLIIDYLASSFFEIKVEQGNIVQSMIQRLRDKMDGEAERSAAILLVLAHKMKGDDKLEVCDVVGDRWTYPLDLALYMDFSVDGDPENGYIATNDFVVYEARGEEYNLFKKDARFHTKVDITTNTMTHFEMKPSAEMESVERAQIHTKGKMDYHDLMKKELREEAKAAALEREIKNATEE